MKPGMNFEKKLKSCKNYDEFTLMAISRSIRVEICTLRW